MASSGNANVAIRLMLILAAAVVLFAFIAYYQKNKAKHERFSTLQPMQAPTQYPLLPQQQQQQQQQHQAPLPSQGRTAAPGAPLPTEPVGNEQYLPVKSDAATAGARTPADTFPQDRITPDQLLPKDATNTKWAQVNPAGQGDVKDQNFLTAGHHIGFNTQGNSLRNASHDLRSSIPNPRYRVSIWQQSTIEPDIRRPLE